MTARSRRSLGISIMAVLVVLMFVSTTVVLLSLTFSADLRRTRNATIGAQLRQLLLAGAQYARQELFDNGPAARSIVAPTPIPDASLNLTFAPVSDADVTVTTTATLDALTTAQSLHFVRESPNDSTSLWTLRETHLTKSP